MLRSVSGLVRRMPGGRIVGRVAWLPALAVLGAVMLASAAPAVADSCPNAAARAGLSAQLPDCRAYEQVSTADKQGVDVGVKDPAVIAQVFAFPAADGDGFVYGAMGAFAGAQTGLPTSYVARRTSTGWTSTWVSPPTVQSDNYPNPVAASDDLTRIVFDLYHATPDGVGPGFVVRDQDGNFGGPTLGTPEDPPYLVYQGRSSDARHIVFQSPDDVIPGVSAPTGGGAHMYELFDGQVQVVDRMPDGSLAPSGAVIGSDAGHPGQYRHAVSANGSRIVFSSPAKGQSTTADPTRVYVRIDGDQTVEASRSQCTRTDCDAPAPAIYEDAAADGSRVLFSTTQQLINGDTDADDDLYSYDVSDGALTRLSAGTGGVDTVLGASADGQMAYFNAGGKLYLSDHGVTRLVATGTSFSGAVGCSVRAEVTASGRFLVFNGGAATAAPGDGPMGAGLFRYDAVANRLQLLTSGPTRLRDALETLNVGCWRNRAVTDDGSIVAFAQDRSGVSGYSDVYEWHDGPDGGKVSLISGVGASSDIIGISRDGRDLFFLTYNPLAPTDTDQAQDIYDARIGGGGFPTPAAPVTCAGATCHPEPSTRPEFAALASVAFAGAGNVAPEPASGAHANTRSTVRVGRVGTVRGAAVRLRVKVSGKGTVRVSGAGVRTVHRRSSRARVYRIKVALTRRARGMLHRRHHLKLRLRVVFKPTVGRASRRLMTVRFRERKRQASTADHPRGAAHRNASARTTGRKGR